MKNIVLLGSTGSIGTQTLDVVRAYGDRLKVVALAAGSSVEKMELQVREFNPLFAVMWEETAAKELRVRVADTETKVLCGMEGLLAICTMPEAQTVVTAMVGMIGIRPTIAAIEAGKDIALANKETLVTAGHIIMPLAKKHKVRILPVDSEHSAIFQSMNGENPEGIKKILLTASGGPFRGKKKEELQNIRVEDALKHPNWAMGQKITIDSATMVNKGLEVMEAGWLFSVAPEQIQVVVHPQSIVHSMVEYKDGAVIAQMGMPDMKLPIQYALFYPERLTMYDNPGTEKVCETSGIDFYRLGNLSFEEPDMNTFYGLRLAYEAFRIGGSMPTVYNAANEMAVSLFLERKIGFLDISEQISISMDEHRMIPDPGVEEILEVEKICRDRMISRLR